MKTRAFHKTYNNRVVLSLPELELPEGKITAVIGPNGSGKSTFAKILAGIERADEKKPILDDADIGYLPQKSFAFRMSTEKNIMQNGGDPARAGELMKVLGIDMLARQSAKKLSGGEMARMALCRILMRPYELLILDEPTTAMDMESTLAAERLIRKTCTEQGCALVLITHSISQARRVSDRVIVLHQGKLVEQGQSAQLLSDPQQEQTRRFLEFYGV
ncbi:MAG: ATP-binding cassette domain-containing protein [Oscillospiraceae bacterium]|nr:ATP-binding cassette domain-containing protein [Oscillospiraceae bacterium]